MLQNAAYRWDSRLSCRVRWYQYGSMRSKMWAFYCNVIFYECLHHSHVHRLYILFNPHIHWSEQTCSRPPPPPHIHTLPFTQHPLPPLPFPLTPHPCPLTPVPSPLSLLPSPLSPHPSPLSPHPSLPCPLTPFPSPLTPFTSPLSPHPSTLSSHPYPLTPLPSCLSRDNWGDHTLAVLYLTTAVLWQLGRPPSGGPVSDSGGPVTAGETTL